MKKFAVIVAGGVGARMQSSVPKQFLLLNGKPVLYYTIDAFLKAYDDLQIILVLPEEHVASGQEIIDAFFNYDRIRIAVGGRSRFHSVQNGLQLVDEESVVFVHDAVRCLVSTTLIKKCNDAVMEYGSAIPVINCKDSVRLITENGNEALDRNNIKLVQTPQCFHSKIILPAFSIDFKDKFTDEATVVEAFGLRLHLIDGEESNIKITIVSDILIAQSILNRRKI